MRFPEGNPRRVYVAKSFRIIRIKYFVVSHYNFRIMVNNLKELFFKNKGVRQTVAKNVFWLSAGELGSRVFRAFIIIYAARVLGAAEYGVFSYVMALTGFFTLFSDIGVSPLLTRE
ncbi:hypothetical protein COS61_01740, partial [Candidatus Wolfebacteria bacterium CG03_land_8_20_14_0_80_40_12]